jgi:putative ubiquitin-RnfH superfamily antitoxin RatB of RatAB toxin-antitoxin module
LTLPQMAAERLIRIEVVFAAEARQRLVARQVPAGTGAREALLGSALPDEFTDFDFGRCAIGVWGHPVADDRPLRDGDRVEAYRPLRQDPRTARRELARDGRTMGGMSANPVRVKDPD